MYPKICKVDGHIECNSIKEKYGSKHLVFDSTNKNKKVFKKYIDLRDGIENEIETMNGRKKSEYDKDFVKIKSNTDDNLLLNKSLKLCLLTVSVRSIFEEDNKFISNLIKTTFCRSYLSKRN